MGVPMSPPGVSLEQNMRKAQDQKEYFSRGGSAFLFSWFYTQVRNRGPWDFKQKGAQYENFGNFHYGAVGIAAGISSDTLLRAAGAAQLRAGTSSSEFGSWWSVAPHGDDPKDQHWITKGIEYAQSMGY